MHGVGVSVGVADERVREGSVVLLVQGLAGVSCGLSASQLL